MELIGQAVRHSVFGEGVIDGRADGMVAVDFPQEGRKIFLFPQAFHDFLELTDPELQQTLLGKMEAKEKEEEKREHEAHAKWEREVTLRNLKISIRSQGAFDVKPDEVDEIFDRGWVSTGTYLSGLSKGEPRTPDRMKANSMCVLTVREEGMPENQRRIAGVFMVADTFCGSRCHDGRVPAHPVYRLKLEHQDRPLFWPYLQPTCKEKWGNATFKYLENQVSQRILQDLQKKHPDMDAFCRYFCRINRIEQK